MVYKSKKRLGRPKAGFGVDGGIMAAATLTAAGMTTAATIASAKQQAEATKQAADIQSRSIDQQSTLQTNAMQQQNENNNKNVTQQIDIQKQANEQRNNILRDMNMNLAIQAGKQNEDEMKEAAKIQVRCGGNLNRRKKLAGGITLQDNSYLMPIGDGAYLLRGGSPSNPQDQTHDNTHKNTKEGGRNTGSYIKVNGREIEAEAGGNKTTGEIVDPNRNIVLSQRRFLPNGTSPVEEVLYNGKSIDQAFAEQETTKDVMGINDNGSKAAYGMPTRLSTRQERKFQNWWSKNAPAGTKPEQYQTDYRRSFKNKLNVRRFLANGGRIKAGLGDWWNRQNSATQSSVLNAGVNVFGTGLNILGNFIASDYMADANKYATERLAEANNKAADTYVKAYNLMHGVDANSLLGQDTFQAAHAIANVRAGRYNINPQLTNIERDLLRQQEMVNKSTNSAAARNKILARISQSAQDERSKWFAEQANRIEAINQGNISELNKMANENADRDTQAIVNRSNAFVELARYNNDIENAKIQGIADAKVNAITGNAQQNAQSALNIANIRGNFASNTSNQLANMFSNIGSTWVTNRQNWDNNQSRYKTALAYSSNPNIMAADIANHPKDFDKNTIETAMNLATDLTLKNKLKSFLN